MEKERKDVIFMQFCKSVPYFSFFFLLLFALFSLFSFFPCQLKASKWVYYCTKKKKKKKKKSESEWEREGKVLSNFRKKNIMFPLFLFALRSFLAPKKERYKIPSQYYSFLIFVFVSFSPSICFAKLVQEKSINQSINQSFIIYSQKKRQ